MKNFKSQFIRSCRYILEAGAPIQVPNLGTNNEVPQEEMPQDQLNTDALTHNTDLQQSLDATDNAGEDIPNIANKLSEWKNQVQQIQELSTKILKELQPTAGQPGLASIWKSLRSGLERINKESGGMLGSLKNLDITIPVSQKAINTQR